MKPMELDDLSEDGEATEESTDESVTVDRRHRLINCHFLSCGVVTGAAGALLLMAVVLPALQWGYLYVGRTDNTMETAWPFHDVKKVWRSSFKGDLASPDPFTLAGKSVYFLIIDRFARAGAGPDYPECTGVTPKFCGGNIQGIIERLDYIQGMGFDCIWITPPVKQYASDSCHLVNGKKWCSDGFSGYWAEDFFEIDPHFGSREDMRALADNLHARKMCLVLDMVTNHAGIIDSDASAERIKPFDKIEYYHQLAGPETFGAVQGLNGTWHPPPDYVSHCGPRNHDNIFCVSWCGPGAYDCPQYDQKYVEQGWFGSLGDLNQSHPFVRKELIRYATQMVLNYSIDAIRLDTAAFMSRGFLAELQEAVGVQIVGEVTTMNMTHQASYQRYPPRVTGYLRSNPVLAGTLNFPLFYYATGAFCGWITFLGRVGPPNMTNLTLVMRHQLDDDLYEDLDLLGNFLDNHDEEARIAYACQNDTSRLKNALAWTLLYKGIPMIYYGTEQGYASKKVHGEWQGDSSIRESLWQSGYNTETWQYRFIKRLNEVRNKYRIGGAAELHTTTTDDNKMVFTRSSNHGHVSSAWVFLNNYAAANASTPQVYCPGPFPPSGKLSFWEEVLSGDGPAVLKDGCYHAPDSNPKVLVLNKHSDSIFDYV